MQRSQFKQAKQITAKFEALSRTRLSPNFILRDFLFSAEAAVLGLSNFPENPEAVVRAGTSLCEKVLEPTLERFGRFAITFGYQCREAIEAGWTASKKRQHSHSSSPHHWDRGTFGNAVYARVDILPFCVEDRNVSKQAFGHWLMHNLDIDLLMQWTRSNVFCITVSPKPRHVWLELGSAKLGEPKQIIFMSAHYRQRVYPTLPTLKRPKFGPSCTGGAIQWRSPS